MGVSTFPGKNIIPLLTKPFSFFLLSMYVSVENIDVPPKLDIKFDQCVNIMKW